VWKKLKYFSNFILITVTRTQANDDTEMATTMMTQQRNTTGGEGGGLSRMTDEDFEQEFSTTLPMTTAAGTPRPGMNDEDAEIKQKAANQAMWNFSQEAARTAAEPKRRGSIKSRTVYCMASSKQVKLAFDALQQKIQSAPELMSQTDFQLLKQAFGNFRMRLIVHDSKTFEELKQMLEQTKNDERAAELETQLAFGNKSFDEQTYLNAKDKFLELRMWSTELAKEIRRIEPKFKPFNMGGGLYRHDFNKPPTDPPGVASQHAQIAPATGAHLRNILRPETICRTFISLGILTDTVRQEVVKFLTDDLRHKDRVEVVKQIKESCIATAAATAAAKKTQTRQH
jgi:hypothetical protein